jgi:hypothetical protein
MLDNTTMQLPRLRVERLERDLLSVKYPVRTTAVRSAFTFPPWPRDVRAELSDSDRRMQPPRAASLPLA